MQAVGKFTVATPGTPIQPFASRPDLPSQVYGLFVQAMPANTGAVYLGDRAIDRVNQNHLYAILATPTANNVPSFNAVHGLAGTGIQVNDLSIDADVAANGVIISILV